MMILSDAIIWSITLEASFVIIIIFTNYDCKIFIVQATMVTITNYNGNMFIVWATDGVSHG
jgi:hypothetical protein